MGPRAVELVAGIIDRIEDRSLGSGRPPMPTIKIVKALRFFLHKGVQWRELRATAARLRLHLAPTPGGLERYGCVAPGPCRPDPDRALGTRGHDLGRGCRQLLGPGQTWRRADRPQSYRPG